MCAPFATSSAIMAAVVARSGSPAARNGIKARRPSLRSRVNSASMRFMNSLLEDRFAANASDLEGIFVAPAREANDQHFSPSQPRRFLHGQGHRVARLERRQNSLSTSQRAIRFERLGV